MKLTDSDEELCRQLIDVLYGMAPRHRVTAHWVMSPAWERRIDEIRTAGISPPPSWALLDGEPRKVLYGKPVTITEDGGAPHMEAEPERHGVLVEPGQDVVYIKCNDPDCPKHKPGLHHAHLETAP